MGWLSIHCGVDLLPVPFDKNIKEGDLVVSLRLLGEFDGWVLVVDVVVESRANGYPKRMIKHSSASPGPPMTTELCKNPQKATPSFCYFHTSKAFQKKSRESANTLTSEQFSSQPTPSENPWSK